MKPERCCHYLRQCRLQDSNVQRKWKQSHIHSSEWPREVTDGLHVQSFSRIQRALCKKPQAESEVQASLWQYLLSIFKDSIWSSVPDMLESKTNDRASRLAGKAVAMSGLRLGKAEVLRSFKRYLQIQSRRHQTVDWLDERGLEWTGGWWFAQKGVNIAIANQASVWTVQKSNTGEKFQSGGVECMWAFPGMCVASSRELSWQESCT